MNGEVEPERATGESPEAALPPALSKPDRVQSQVRVGERRGQGPVLPCPPRAVRLRWDCSEPRLTREY